MTIQEGIATELQNYIRWTVLDPETVELLKRAIEALRAPATPAVMADARERVGKIIFDHIGADRNVAWESPPYRQPYLECADNILAALAATPAAAMSTQDQKTAMMMARSATPAMVWVEEFDDNHFDAATPAFEINPFANEPPYVAATPAAGGEIMQEQAAYNRGFKDGKDFATPVVGGEALADKLEARLSRDRNGQIDTSLGMKVGPGLCEEISAAVAALRAPPAAPEMFKCNCPFEVRSGCSEPKCPHYVRPAPLRGPSVEAMKAAVELEIHAALGQVQTIAIGRMIQKAIDAALAVSPLRGREITDEMVNIAAKAAAENAGFNWDACAQSQWISDMRSGLTAALSAAPTANDLAEIMKLAGDDRVSAEALGIRLRALYRETKV